MKARGSRQLGRRRTRKKQHSGKNPSARIRPLGEALEARRLLALSVELIADLGLDGGSGPRDFVEAGGIAFFSANDKVNGRELWRTDGTTAGTFMVKDILPGRPNGYPSELTAVGDVLFFRADDGESGRELWRSDGTEAGTFRVADINPGLENSYPSDLTALGNMLFFRADDGISGSELWKSDGTAAGTQRVADINPGLENAYPIEITPVGNNVFFRATDGQTGRELWQSDGTAAGTRLVQDIRPGAANSYPSELIAFQDEVFFRASDGSQGSELWRSDGTAAGTQIVADIFPGSGSAYPVELTVSGDLLYFRAGEGVSGRELWKSDGTAAGTSLVEDIFPGPTNSYPSSLTDVDGTLFFRANNGVNGRELWRSDGTTTGTFLVADIRPGPENSYPIELTFVKMVPLGPRVYFRANDGSSGRELWRSDGTVSGTERVADLNPGPENSYPVEMAEFNGALLFGARTGDDGREPWILRDIVGDQPTADAGGPYVINEGDSLTLDATGSFDPQGGSLEFAWDLNGDGVTDLSGPRSGNGTSSSPAISADGRFLAFASDADDLVAGDQNNVSDVYLYDRETGTTTLVSRSLAGDRSGNNSSISPVISADGRFVAYTSRANDLVPEADPNNNFDVFLWDRITGNTTLLSTTGERSGSGASIAPSISDDGSVVAFASDAPNLAANDANGEMDVFVWTAGATVPSLVSASNAGSGNGFSFPPQVSGNGQFLVFASEASNLVPGDNNGSPDVFLWSRATQATRLVSRAVGSTSASNGFSFAPVISSDGLTVAYASTSSDLAAADTNNDVDVFVWDAVSGTNRLISRGAGSAASANGRSHSPEISADGNRVVFASGATNLTSEADANGGDDVFLWTEGAGNRLISRSVSGNQTANATSFSPTISADGSTVAFSSDATNLTATADANQASDVYRWTAGTGNDLISQTAQSAAANGLSFIPTLDASGESVAFVSDAGNLTEFDGNGTFDVFVRDLTQDDTVLASSARDIFHLEFDALAALGLDGEGIFTIRLTVADEDGNTSTDVTTISIGDAAPSAQIVGVQPDPIFTAVDEVVIQFSEPVTNFGLEDLRLFRVGEVAGNLLTGDEALTTTDGKTYTLDGLASLTGEDGLYLLLLAADGSDILDATGNPLANNVEETWTKTAASANLGSAANSVADVDLPASALEDSLRDIFGV